MDKLSSTEVLKMMQSLVLPLELKINSLVDMVRSLESKVDKLQEQKDNKQHNISEGTTTESAVTTVSNKRPKQTTESRPTSSAAPVMTRRQRARMPADVVSSHSTRVNHHPVEKQSSPDDATALSSQTETSTLLATKDNAATVNQEDGQWILQQRRRKYRQPILRGTGESDTDLESVEKTKRIHLWSLRADTTAEKVKAYMLKKKLTVAVYDVQKLELKHQNYSSFVITVPESAFDFFYDHL